MTSIVGVDPGATWTGVVLRTGNQAVRACVVTREGGTLAATADYLDPGPTYLHEVVGVVRDYCEQGGEGTLIAVEALRRPNANIGRGTNPSARPVLANPAGAIITGMVIGALLVVWPDLILVRPRKHGDAGSRPLQSYPEILRPVRGRGKGADRLRHARSAWDVTEAALVLARTGGRWVG